jgi:Ca-activated chloride channel homolog
MSFRNPELLLFALLVPLALLVLRVLARRGRVARPAFRFSNLAPLAAERPTWRSRGLAALPALRVLAGILLAIALARPQLGRTQTRIVSEGIDIVLALDLSSSMLAEDMGESGDGGYLNRVDASKRVIAEFIANRRDDRIGLVVFAGHAFTQCPLTLDYGILKGFLDLIRCVEPGGADDGTAIGSGVATAVARLEESKAKSRVVILLTDGSNNRGEIDPERAARLAAEKGVKVYTVGAGSRGLARIPVTNPITGEKMYRTFRSDLDEDTLKTIAEISGGRYFRAANVQGLEETYAEIDRLEKTKRETPRYLEYDELFAWPLGAAILVFIAELLLRGTVFRRIP